MSGDNFTRAEVSSIYVSKKERFIVSLIVGYDTDRDDVLSPQEAGALAVDLTKDGGSAGTVWFVFDRLTGESYQFDQCELVAFWKERAIRQRAEKIARGGR